jgi:hypothetical protein
MPNARASLIHQLQGFFETRLCGLYRWQTAGDFDDIPPPGTVRVRMAEKRPKTRGQRQLDKEVVAVDFDGYALMISSPDEVPPIGQILLFHPDHGVLVDGPLDVVAWDAAEIAIKERQDKWASRTTTTAMSL